MLYHSFRQLFPPKSFLHSPQETFLPPEESGESVIPDGFTGTDDGVGWFVGPVMVEDSRRGVVVFLGVGFVQLLVAGNSAFRRVLLVVVSSDRLQRRQRSLLSIKWTRKRVSCD